MANRVGCQEVSCVSAFRCFGYLNVTLTESGNSVLKHHMQLWHLRLHRITHLPMLTQIHEFNSFLNQVTSSSGKGPCSLTHNRANRATQIHAVRPCTAEFSNKCAHSETIEENTNPQVFVPSCGARHRPVKTKTGIEGTFL